MAQPLPPAPAGSHVGVEAKRNRETIEAILSKDSNLLKQLAIKHPTIAAEVCRLFIARNILSTLTVLYVASLTDSNRSAKELADGDRLVHFLLTVGVIKEGLDAFSQVDRCSWLQANKALRKSVKYQGIRAFLQNEVNSKDSFYSRFIRPTRDDAAFHWRRGKIEKLLRQLLDDNQKWPALLVTFSIKTRDSRFPIGDQLLIRLAEWDATSPEMETHLKRVSAILVRLVDYADALATLLF